MSHALAMPEPRHKIAVFTQDGWQEGTRTYSWDEIRKRVIPAWAREEVAPGVQRAPLCRYDSDEC